MFSKSFYFIIFFSRKCFHQKNIRFQKHLYHVKKKCVFRYFVFKKIDFPFLLSKEKSEFCQKRGNAFKKCVFISLKNVFTMWDFLKKKKFSLKKKSGKLCFQNVFFLFTLKNVFKENVFFLFHKNLEFFPKKAKKFFKNIVFSTLEFL